MKPTLCVIDIQKEYNSPGRPFYIPGIVGSLKNGKTLLDFARKNEWRIIHVQHLQGGNIFSHGSDYSDFVEGFEPLPGELVCIKDNFSSFSSPDFTLAVSESKSSEIIVIGYGSTMCCLSTIIDGYHRGYNFTFIADASNAKPTPTFDNSTLHGAATEILRTFCKVKNLNAVLGLN